jgi:hypothetical protein
MLALLTVFDHPIRTLRRKTRRGKVVARTAETNVLGMSENLEETSLTTPRASSEVVGDHRFFSLRFSPSIDTI